MIAFGTQMCGDLRAGSQREWLLSDGLGGYATGTVTGLRTRRYHGLLTIAETPARRHLAVAALDPVLVPASGARVALGVHEWAGGVIDPRGHLLLERFDLRDGVPRWRWRVGDVVLEREVAMTHATSGVSVSFRQLAGPSCDLEVRALVTWRDSHDQRRAHGALDVAHDATGCVVEGRFRVHGPGWNPDGRWYHGVLMREESARGLADTEDLWSAGTFRAPLTTAGEGLEVRAWAIDATTQPPPHSAADTSRARARGMILRAGAVTPLEEHLTLAADSFVVAGPDVVAGYPWFGSWSRDTMISFEGLFLVTGRVEEGRALLVAYAQQLSDGMLPNTADTGRVEYNTADATLWFVHALDRYLARTDDLDLQASAAPWLADIIGGHVRGTRHGIHVDRDGLLTQGADRLALTWMDARVDGMPVTPRAGKPVEINALWINALAVTRAVHDRLALPTGELARLEAAARRSFARRMAPSPTVSLADVVDGPGGDDLAVRPNQFVAMSLPHGPAVDARALASLGGLLTPLGPRSLHPMDPAYRGRHAGSPGERDLAYHQGTVWPWLVGPYVDAALRAGTATPTLLDGLSAHVSEWGLGSVSETASGEPPHQASGAPFQAWSVAETLRAWRRLNRTGHERGDIG
ncbi:MAG: amylo-alpha-1,6-glucosidase [Ferruginibacter sp.]